MGCGSWTSNSFKSYSKSVGRSVSKSGVIDSAYSNQEMFKARTIDPALNPKNVIRECCDSEEHPNTLPVILAVDVTGSMGDAAVEIAKKLNVIMTKLYKDVKDVEFMIMGIGDLAYDDCPIQVSQFESDIRIAEQLDKIYFEFGGGGNSFELSLLWVMSSLIHIFHIRVEGMDYQRLQAIIFSLMLRQRIYMRKLLRSLISIT